MRIIQFFTTLRIGIKLSLLVLCTFITACQFDESGLTEIDPGCIKEMDNATTKLAAGNESVYD